MVFLPSTRYGSFSVETSYQPSRSLRSATYLPQSEINPSSFTTFAPNAWHSITFAAGVSARIPRRGGRKNLRAKLFRSRDGGGHAAGFEGAGGIQAFVFYIEALQSHG